MAWLIFAVMMTLGLVIVGALYAVARRAYQISPKIGEVEAPALPPATTS